MLQRFMAMSQAQQGNTGPQEALRAQFRNTHGGMTIPQFMASRGGMSSRPPVTGT